jgi:dienelactone hydrolase
MQTVFNKIAGQCGVLRAMTVAVVALAFCFGNDSRFEAQADDQPVKHFTTPDGVEYGVWNQTTDKPAPVLFVLASTIDATLGQAYFRQSGNELAEHGWISVSIDLPCHGKQVREGEPSGLGGWSYRLAKDEDVVAEFNARLSKVLDHLIKTGAADPERIAVCGTSRGGFLALHFAAHDKRVKCAAAFAPVTDPRVVNEFVANAEHPFVVKANLENQAEKLAGRPVWIVIGDQDARVGTDRAVALAQKLTAASREKKLDSRVELHVMPEPRGHTTPKGSSRRAADWILDQFPKAAANADSKATSDARRTGSEILFVDDHDVLYRSGTERVFHPATLNPTNPVIREDRAWEMAIGWTSIYRDPTTGKYQLWYQAYGGGRDERKSHKCVVCYAESDDGINFTKPELPVHDFNIERLS